MQKESHWPQTSQELLEREELINEVVGRCIAGTQKKYKYSYSKNDRLERQIRVDDDFYIDHHENVVFSSDKKESFVRKQYKNYCNVRTDRMRYQAGNHRLSSLMNTGY